MRFRTAVASAALVGTTLTTTAAVVPYHSHKETDLNWAGLVDYGSFRAIDATWQVPFVNSNPYSIQPPQVLSQWVGFNGTKGHYAKSILQAGVDEIQNAGQVGTLSQVWVEIYPAPTKVLFDVNIGDTVTVSISHNSGNSYNITATDSTLNIGKTLNVTYPYPLKSAEFITEDPATTLNHFLPMMYFVHTSFEQHILVGKITSRNLVTMKRPYATVVPSKSGLSTTAHFHTPPGGAGI